MENSGHVVVSVSSDFLSNSKQDTLFRRIACDYFLADWDDLCDHFRDVPCENNLELITSAAASKFFERVQVRVDVYISHCKNQFKPHLCPWFAAAGAATIVCRNHLFHLYQQNRCSEFKGKFGQASNCCKRVLEAANLHILVKLKSLFRETLLLGLIKLLIVFSTKVTLKMVKKVLMNLDSSTIPDPDCI